MRNMRALYNFMEKINSANNFKELADIINNGFIKNSDAQACWTGIIDNTANHIEIRRLKTKDKCNKDLLDEVKYIRQTIIDLYENFEVEDVDEFITTNSCDNKILNPIIFRNSIVGYFGMISDTENFHDLNIDVAKLISSCINSKFEILTLKEEQKNSSIEKTEFLASISHEFKTPLNSIMGFSDILSEKIKDPQDLRFLHNISQSSVYLMKLIQNIIDYSSSEYKPFDLKIEKLRPKVIIENVLENFEQLRKEKNIIFNYTLSDIIIEGDLLRIKQVIYNLISNAVKFSKENSIISIVTYINDKNEFIFEIQDKGDGISKKDIAKIFNFFSLVNKDQMNSQQGSGIGLALCKKILRAHGGDIFVKSKPHMGSTFWFSIPIKSKY